MENVKKAKVTKTVSVSMPEAEQRSETNHTENDTESKSDDSHLWEQLPLVVVLNVFDYLEQSDLLRLATVCQTWRNVIHDTSHFWRNMHLKLNCNSESLHSERSCWYAEIFGNYFRKLSVSCDHEHHTDICKCIDKDLLQILLNLHEPNLTSLKITDLALQGVRTCQKSISEILIRMLSSFNNLQCFQMPNAKFRYNEANAILENVFSVSRGTLHSLAIDGFFRVSLLDYKSNEVDKLTDGILSLSRLTKLGIDYLHLTDDFLTALSESHAGQLKVLKIVARVFMHYNTRDDYKHTISTRSWLALKNACPAMKVAFVVDGFTLSNVESIKEIVNPVLPIYKICLTLGNSNTDIVIVLNDITAFFRKSLVKFEMEIALKNHEIDASFLEFVLDCKRLTSVNVSAEFLYPETERVAQQVTQQRKRYQDMMLSLEQSKKRAQANTADGPGSGIANATAPVNGS